MASNLKLEILPKTTSLLGANFSVIGSHDSDVGGKAKSQVYVMSIDPEKPFSTIGILGISSTKVV